MSAGGGVWAVSMMRDEVDVAAATVTHLFEEGVDGVLVFDNRSVDGTGDALRELSQIGQISVLDDPEPGYYQSEKMTRLAQLAREHHRADWILPFDADEVWYAAEGRLGDVLRAIPGDGPIVFGCPLYNHFATSIDGNSGEPFADMVWRQPRAGELPKVLFRWQDNLDTIGQGNHSVSFGGHSTCGKYAGGYGIALRHFPYRGFEHFARKARNGAEAYRHTDYDVTVGAHWRQYGEILERHGPDALREVYETWFWHLAPVEAGLIHDPAPWRRWAEPAP